MTAGQFITHAQREISSPAPTPHKVYRLLRGPRITACLAFVILITLPQAIYRIRAWCVYIARAKRVYRSRKA